MEKTLDALVFTYQLMLGVALAILIVGIAIHHPKNLYDAAEKELESLQDAIGEVSDQVNDAYQDIYNKSELKASIVEWLHRRKLSQPQLRVRPVLIGEFAIPDSNQNPVITLEAQVK